nr:reverse transcriptase domain-containing protein [Tanacetum cinerariifolium]
ECLALADLGASIYLIPFFVRKRLSLPDLTPTCMTLELSDRSISSSVGVAEDVYVKVGLFHFSADFVVVDFDADPRVPLILERSQTSRYSANYSDMTAKRIDIIDMACEEYSQEFLGFSDTILSGNPTRYYDLIVSTTSPTLTPFGNSDFLLKEVDAFLAIEDDPTRPEFYQPYLDPEGDILLLEAFLNDDPSPHPNQGNYLPKVVEVKPEATKDTMNPTNNGSTKEVQPQVVQSKSTSEPATSSISKPVIAPEFLGFSDTILSGNPTRYYDLIVSTTSLTLTPFGNSDFLLKKVDAFLAIEDNPTPPEFYQPYLDPKGDILLLEAFLNDDPSPHPNQGN